MRVDNITPEHNAEFESVKRDLVADWVRDAQRKQAYVRANEILVDVNAGNEMVGKKSATVSRASGAPNDVLVAAFKSGIGTNSIVESGDAFYVMTVKADAKPVVNDKKIAELGSELKTLSTKQIADDYNSFLMREYPVKINEKVYHRFLGNNQ